jgi:hypothetical protein
MFLDMLCTCQIIPFPIRGLGKMIGNDYTERVAVEHETIMF